MRPRPLARVAAAVRGTVIPADAGDDLVHAVVIDSREARAGRLFVALPGERADGHSFVADVHAAGGAAMVRAGWSHTASPPAGPVVEVADPHRALMDLAADERAALSPTVVGITGSAGKTCTKDFVAAVLSRRLRVVASERSFNNEVGLPLTLLRAGTDTQVLVCEMGSRGPGHIRVLCDVAHPDIGVVTNVGVAHMELFGSPEVLRDAKAELPEALPAGGTAVLNADDPVVRGFAERTPARPLFFGTSAPADIRAEDITISRENGCATFVLLTPGQRAAVTLPVPGEHMVSNALAAAAVGWTLDVEISDIAAGLAATRVSGGRMESFTTPDGLRVVDDSYNANPASMAAALRSARWMAGDGRMVAVLGHMAELGPAGPAEHERVGELLARLGVDALITVGGPAEMIAVGAEREGIEPERIVRAADHQEALAAVRGMTRPGDLVLVKASRVARLERIADALRRSREPIPGEVGA